MNTYDVINKATGEKVYEYRAAVPAELGEWTFDLFDHVLVATDASAALPPPVYGGRRQLTHLEFRALFTRAEVEAIDAFEVSFETDARLSTEQKAEIRTNFKEFALATFVDLDDPKYVPGLKGYEALGLLAAGRTGEILRG